MGVRGCKGMIWGSYRDSGKEKGSYYLGFRVLSKITDTLLKVPIILHFEYSICGLYMGALFRATAKCLFASAF